MTIWVTAPQTAERNQGHGCQWGGMQIHVRALPSCFPIPLPPIDSWTTPRKLWVGSSNPLQIILFKWYLCYSQSHSVMSNYLQPHRLYSSWNYPGQNTGVGSLSLLQGIFPIQVSCTAGGFFTSSAIRDGLAVLEGSYVNIYFTFSKWRVLSLYIRSLGNVLVQNIKFIFLTFVF